MTAKFTFKHVVGPGTPAWTAFDRAEMAYWDYRETSNPRDLKRYYNQRQYMIDLLRKHREPVAQWTRTLDAAIGKTEY